MKVEKYNVGENLFYFQTYYFENFSLEFRNNKEILDISVSIWFFKDSHKSEKYFVTLVDAFQASPYMIRFDSFLSLIKSYIKEVNEKEIKELYVSVVELITKAKGI